jgi:uncharacterized membrane protein YgcG
MGVFYVALFKKIQKSEKKTNGIFDCRNFSGLGYCFNGCCVERKLFDYAKKSKRKLDATNAIHKFKKEIIESATSSDLLAQIGDANGYPCLRTRKNCGPSGNTFQNLDVFDRTGAAIATTSNPTFGFRHDGVTCTSFPSVSCPMRYSVTWRALCDGVSCDAPQLQVRGVLQVDNSYSSDINSSVYRFEQNLGQAIGSYEQSCLAMGGVYVPGNPPSCQINASGNCPVDAQGTQQIVVGYNQATKTMVCQPALYLQGQCAGDEVMIGIDPTGAAICRTFVAPVCCPDPSNPATCTCAPPPPSEPSLPSPGDGGDGGDGGGGDGGGDGGCGTDGGGDGCTN